MARKNRPQKEKNKKYKIDYLSGDPDIIDLQASYFNKHPASKHAFKPKNQAQQTFVNAIRNHTLTFGLGPAGTGKSYCAAAIASDMFREGEIDEIIFTRPAIETGKGMGFLPGKLDQKFTPYFDAFKACLTQLLGKGVVECAVKNGNLSLSPLAYMRGKTFNRAFVVLDEAQNCTAEELKMFMTRIGRSSTVVISGDLSQADLKGYSGLNDAIHRVHDVRGVYVHEFGYHDIVRSDIVKDILLNYETQSPKKTYAFQHI